MKKNKVIMSFRYIIIAIIVWSVLVGLSLTWNVIHHNEHIFDLARNAAQENFNKDQAFRRWGTRHGGIYVKADERTPPNPALAHISDRDIVMKDGTKLTLMNPAYMLRQMMNEYDELYRIKAKITGLVLLNPINAPDEWEEQALHKFMLGITEISEQTVIDGKPFLRFMKPVFMEQGCMKCHGHLGLKVGELRGGVGVAIPLQSYLDGGIDMLIMIWVGHGLVWLLGIFTIIILFYFKSQQEAALLKNCALEQEAFNAEKSNQIKSEFLSRMSHELRTPMNAILGFAQMLKLDKKDFNNIQNQNVSEIITASNYLMNLIDDVLDLSKIEAGKLDITMQQVIVVDLMQQITMLIQPLAQSRNIKVIDELVDNEYVVMADVVRLKQVLMNFLSNAVKYNRDGGSIFIRGYVTDKKRLRINITDTGYGLSENQIDKLFTPFERLDNINNVEGTGIGLVISKHLVELMGGEIGVESSKGSDCTFWIELDLIH